MRKLALILVVALTAAGLSGCGSDDDPTTAATSTPAPAAEAPGTAPTTGGIPEADGLPLMDDIAGDARVRYVADPEGGLAFNISEASASEGKVTIEFVNPQKIEHNLVIAAPNGRTVAKTKTIGHGRTSTGAVLKPIVYLAYCSLPGHRKAGMTGHLTVYPG